MKLLRDLLRQISPREIEEYDKMEKTMLESNLHDLLLGKTYLIVSVKLPTQKIQIKPPEPTTTDSLTRRKAWSSSLARRFP